MSPNHTLPRKFGRRLAFAALALGALFAGQTRVHACSCTGILPPKQELTAADAVFTGKVVKLTKVGVSEGIPDLFRGYDVTIELASVIKGHALTGQSGQTVTIFTGAGYGDCGYSFEEGESYLIYASGPKSKLETHICTRTQPLQGAESEVQELLGTLPKIATPSHPPQLVLKGTIDDAGYRGYVFELRNYLHERIFYASPVAQVFRDGRWEDYPYNSDIAPRADAPTADVPEILRVERKHTAEDEADRARLPGVDGIRGMRHLSRMSSEAHFAALQSQSLPWRIGFAYATEPEINHGQKLSKSEHFVWGPRIEASTEAKKLTFDEAFKDTGMIPYPLGTNSAEDKPKANSP